MISAEVSYKRAGTLNMSHKNMRLYLIGQETCLQRLGQELKFACGARDMISHAWSFHAYRLLPKSSSLLVTSEQSCRLKAASGLRQLCARARNIPGR
jgi:hypothetical protein